MKKFLAFVTLVSLSFLGVDLGFSQTNKELAEVRRQIEALKNGQVAIQKDLAEIKNLLLQKELQAMKDMFQAKQGPTPSPAPTAEAQTVVLSVDGGAVKGEKNAKVTLIEFTDYQCPFCSRHFREVMPQIDTDYVKTGKVRYVLREFPLEQIHPNAFKAAEAANCSGEQAKYWEMHDRLFANQNALAAKELGEHAKAVGLDLTKFQQCVDSGKYTGKVRKDFSDAQRAGVTGTPTFFLGLTDPKVSEVKAVRRIVGAQSYAAFKEAIDSLLGTEN
jgi:protein-disulfide isomerase